VQHHGAEQRPRPVPPPRAGPEALAGLDGGDADARARQARLLQCARLRPVLLRHARRAPGGRQQPRELRAPRVLDTASAQRIRAALCSGACISICSSLLELRACAGRRAKLSGLASERRPSALCCISRILSAWLISMWKLAPRPSHEPAPRHGAVPPSITRQRRGDGTGGDGRRQQARRTRSRVCSCSGRSVGKHHRTGARRRDGRRGAQAAGAAPGAGCAAARGAASESITGQGHGGGTGGAGRKRQALHQEQRVQLLGA
jgi:hypothetical protein